MTIEKGSVLRISDVEGQTNRALTMSPTGKNPKLPTDENFKKNCTKKILLSHRTRFRNRKANQGQNCKTGTASTIQIQPRITSYANARRKMGDTKRD